MSDDIQGRGKYISSDDAADDTTGVLKNKLGITDEDALDEVETELLAKAFDRLSLEYSDTHVFTAKDVCHLHKVFLGDVFEWAGTYRNVDVSSPDIRWSHARFIPEQMERFEKELLKRYTPFTPDLSREDALQRLAKIHGELIIIHPFRDGNGRTTRLLCSLLLVQATRIPTKVPAYGEPSYRKRYHEAIQQVWKEAKYDKLIVLLDEVIPKW